MVKRGTIIQVELTENPSSSCFSWVKWRPYKTTEDRFYDKSEVWDVWAAVNQRADVPEWARRNIMEHGYTVIQCKGKYAMVPRQHVEFVD